MPGFRETRADPDGGQSAPVAALADASGMIAVCLGHGGQCGQRTTGAVWLSHCPLAQTSMSSREICSFASSAAHNFHTKSPTPSRFIEPLYRWIRLLGNRKYLSQHDNQLGIRILEKRTRFRSKVQASFLPTLIPCISTRPTHGQLAQNTTATIAKVPNLLILTQS